MAADFTYHHYLNDWECQTSTGVGALGMDGIGSSARHAWRPISPSLNFCNFSFKRKVNEYRMYDPTMSSFLSVDAYVQSPDNSQAFNRYAYCWYNPLRYVDPTGWYMDNPKTDRALPPPDGDGIVDDGGNYSGNSSSGLVVYQDTFTRYDDGRCSIGYSYNGVGGVYCWDNWKRLFSNVPSTHGQGTTYSDPSYYYPTISHNNGSGGHGTGGNIGGGNKTRQTANAVGQLTNTIVSGTSALYGCQATTIYKYPDLLTDLGKNMSKADKAKFIGQTTRAGELITAKSSARAFGEAAAKAVGKTGNVLGKIGIGIEVAQIVLTGEVDAGNVYNVVIGACGLIPGAGWVIGGVAIVGDIVSYAFTGQTIGQHIDNAFDNKKITIYKGVY